VKKKNVLIQSGDEKTFGFDFALFFLTQPPDFLPLPPSKEKKGGTRFELYGTVKKEKVDGGENLKNKIKLTDYVSIVFI